MEEWRLILTPSLKKESAKNRTLTGMEFMWAMVVGKKTDISLQTSQRSVS